MASTTERQELSGKVNFADFEIDEYVQGLEPVAERLQEDFPDVKLDAKALAAFIPQLMQFMEDALGIQALPPRPCSKLPAKLLNQRSRTGAVFVLAKKCEEIRRSRGLKKIDFANPARRNENLDIFLQMRGELIKLGLLKGPKIHLHASLQEQAPQLQRAAMQLGAELMSSPDAPGVTHIVYPFGPNGDPDDGLQYMRKLTSRGSKALVHWWYAPDSYDAYINADIAPEEAEPDRRIRGPWKVYTRWLSDSAKYNEWMNPIDYETEEFQQEQETVGPDSPRGFQLKEGRASDVAKRKRADPGGGPAAKRSVLMGEGLKPGLRRKGSAEAPRPASVEDITYGQRDPVGAFQPNRGIPAPPAPAGASAADQEPSVELYRVPACAAWFSYQDTHSHEQRFVPEFFDGQSPDKTPGVYRDIHNKIVNQYREDSSRHLTYTACRQALGGDANVILRIWTFLDDWGLINFQAKPRDSHADTHLQTTTSDGAPAGYRMLYAPPTSADALHRAHPPSVSNAVAALTGTATGGVMLNLASRRDEHARSAVHAPDPQARFFCNAMPWVDCTACRYHCTKMPDVDLCPEAFAEGRFPPGCSGKDFIRIDQPHLQMQGNGQWKDLETLLLLEGIELYGDNWADIAAHVGTKSQVQCISHFLQLPIEDEFMPDLGRPQGASAPPPAPEPTPQLPSGNGATAASDPQRGSIIPEGQPIPFADAGNPIMAQMAFLAAMVGPKVAAAAAQAALESLTAEDPAIAHEAAQGMASSNASTPEPPKAEADGPPSVARVRIAAATALGAAAVKARVMADEEEREVRRCVLAAAEAQMERINLKLQHLETLETVVESERKKQVAARGDLFVERLKLQKDKLAAAQAAGQPLRLGSAAPAFTTVPVP